MPRSRQGPPSSLSVPDAILALGHPEFATAFPAVLATVARCDLFSVFTLRGPSRIELLFAGGHGADPEFPRMASEFYASGHWRADPAMKAIVAGGALPERPVHQHAQQIPRSEYRHFCYDKPRVQERVSIFDNRAGSGPVLLNLYRTASSLSFGTGDIDRIASHSRMLLALASRHAALVHSRTLGPVTLDLSSITAGMRMAAPGLSLREAEVCAGLLLGRSFKEISNERDIEATTVITYKRRAFQKLGITTRRELHGLYGRCHRIDG